MPTIKYRHHKFNAKSLKIIERANAIIADYQAQNLIMTVRQLFYVLVTENAIPNRERSYKNLIATLTLARYAGLVDWLAIEDRTRGLRDFPSWETENDIIRAAVDSFRRDKWKSQEFRPEVWIEKQALEGVVSAICSELEVPFYVCRGHSSSSEMFIGAMRLRDHIQQGKKPIVFYLGDHDPSGIHMSKDVGDRLFEFIRLGECVQRIALNMSQVRRLQLPPNPAKQSDPRYRKYADRFGTECWELDALNPKILRDLISEHVMPLRDADAWAKEVAIEDDARAHLSKIATNYDRVRKYVDRLKN